jgi:hypothetical protein
MLSSVGFPQQKEGVSTFNQFSWREEKEEEKRTLSLPLHVPNFRNEPRSHQSFWLAEKNGIHIHTRRKVVLTLAASPSIYPLSPHSHTYYIIQGERERNYRVGEEMESDLQCCPFHCASCEL